MLLKVGGHKFEEGERRELLNSVRFKFWTGWERFNLISVSQPGPPWASPSLSVGCPELLN